MEKRERKTEIIIKETTNKMQKDEEKKNNKINKYIESERQQTCGAQF